MTIVSKGIARLFAAAFVTVASAGSMFVAGNAFAQTIVPATGPLLSFEVTIRSLATRPAGANGVYAMHVVVDQGININCLSDYNNNARFWPIIFSDRPDFKLIKETAQLSLAMGKKVRIYAASCSNWSAADSSSQYPIIWGVDTL